MNKTNVDQALAALADALKSSEPNTFIDNPKEFVKKIPLRSLSGDHINGGKIQNFSSAGIVDQSSKQQITVTDNGVCISRFSSDITVDGKITADYADFANLHTNKIIAKEIVGEIKYANDQPITFSGDNIDGKGLLWAGHGYTKQLIFASNPDRIFVSENIDIAKGKSLSINNVKVIDENTLGTTITKSSLREVGRLKGLIVDGSAILGEHFYFDGQSNRLGIGTEQPNATISILENSVELIVGTKDNAKAIIGTYTSNGLDIVTDNSSRINVSSDGNITLGNFKSPPIQVNINGKLAIKISNPDPDVDLHIAGAVKFSGRLQTRGNGTPDGGYYNKGDIIWNDDPKVGSYVGWVCVQPGTPGLWEPFGKIGNQ